MFMCGYVSECMTLERRPQGGERGGKKGEDK